MKIAIGCNEAAYELKLEIMSHLESKGHIMVDFGSGERESVLSPNVAYALFKEVVEEKFERGILLCGTGIGMTITANKVSGVWAAVCHDSYSTEKSRKFNNCQIMTMGARVVSVELANNLVDVWMESEFSGGGSQAKVDRISEIESECRKSRSNIYRKVV